jgi:DNA-binding PadR family transcriptional regulator
MHPYELQSIIRITHKDDFLRLNPGSLYNSIERLLQAGLIEVAETTRAGRRPERTVYRITPQGCREATQWLRELLEKPAADTTWFFAALSFLPALDPRDVAEQLRKRLTHLESEIHQHKHVLKHLTAKVGRLSLIELEYSVALRTAEHRWVRRIISELGSPKLNWNPEMLRKHASRFFATCLPARTPGTLTSTRV